MSSKIFCKKATALKYLKPNQILANNDIKKYFILNSYQDFQAIIENTPSPSFYEFIPASSNIKLFLDIEIPSSHYEFTNHIPFINNVKYILTTFLTKLNIQCSFVVLESHNDIKKSYHIIIKGPVFNDIKKLKKLIIHLFPNETKNNIIDTSVYREGLFRTYLSTKSNEARPLVKSHLSDDFDFLDTFVCYNTQQKPLDLDPILKSFKPSKSKSHSLIINTQNKEKNSNPDSESESNSSENTDNEYIDHQDYQYKDLTFIDKSLILKFVRKFYKQKENDISDIFIDHKFNCFVVALTDTFCYNIDREHRSNHQYIIIDTFSSKQKCHDTECLDYKHNEIKINNYPKELNELILRYLKVNKFEQELISNAISECKDYIIENFGDTVDEIEFDKNEMVFKGDISQSSLVKLQGKCTNCHVEHQIGNSGYCLRCKICNSIFPKNQLIPIDDRFKHLNNFWNSYSQLVNNGTVNINIYQNTGEEDFSCDVQLDNSIFQNKELTKIFNQVLDGHKVIKISELLYKYENDFVYTNGIWYNFNGSIWKQDKESLEFRKCIVKLSNEFHRIKTYYENQGGESSSNIVKNTKSLINKLYKPAFEEEITKGAKMYYNDETFIKNLNSKKHLVPFTNGVFDLLTNQFRKTTKDDYINLTMGFDYDENISNPEVYTFLEQVLPIQSVRDYVLKKMSDCLNGDIPNTNFLIFIGDTGANGKSQLLNLMKLTMGEFGEKVEVTLLTRKRNNANEANSEKIKLMNKRYAFLSEPEDGEKINIGLLKELTGSEEIVARGLYQDALSFVMEAKLFLACNELPEIKGEDTALWRRIRAIDFPSRFIDEPKEQGEYQIDRTLPSRMREDLSWRQTFIKILLNYYNKKVIEPEEVKVKTNEYRQENNEFELWCIDNIQYKENAILKLSDVCELYIGKKVGPRVMSKYRKDLEKFIKSHFPQVLFEYKQFWISDQSYKGWLHLQLSD